MKTLGVRRSPATSLQYFLVLLLCGLLAACTTIQITSQPQSQTVTDGQSVTFTIVAQSGAAAQGNGTLSYQWQRNGVKIAGATAASYTFTATLADNGAKFTVLLTDANDPVTSDAATLTVTAKSLSLLAGSAGGAGNLDGTGSGARFNGPAATATDAAGNIYVADTQAQTIRKITPAGVVSTLAGQYGSAGYADGTGSAVRFNNPQGLAYDGNGSLYVADTGNNVIRKLTVTTGAVSTLAGSAGAVSCSSLSDLGAPTGITLDNAGNLYVVSVSCHTLLKVTTTGTVSFVSSTLAALQASAPASSVVGVALDNLGNAYLSDYAANVIVKVVLASGTGSIIAGSGTGRADGTGTSAQFYQPWGIVCDGSGNLYVTDSHNSTVRKIVLSSATVSTIAGSAGARGAADGTGTAALFDAPLGLSRDASGNIYVADSGNQAVRKLVPGTGVVSTLAGLSGNLNYADGTGAAARFNASLAGNIAADSSGNLYVADASNQILRKVTAGGVVSTFVGVPLGLGSLDSVLGTPSFNLPSGVAVDSTGTLYVVDTGNSAVRKITAGLIVTTLAGSAGQTGSGDGTGAAARFNAPQGGIAVDTAGNVYVADTGNHTIRKITAAGVVTTLAGSVGQAGSADGTGSSARFNAPLGLALDGSGNLLVADQNNSTIRKIVLASGAVSTLAGSAGVSGGADGTGSSARFSRPTGLAVDGSGNLYVADAGNGTVRKVSAAGVVSTVVGVAGRIGSVTGSLPTTLGQVTGVAVVGSHLYISSSAGVLSADL